MLMNDINNPLPQQTPPQTPNEPVQEPAQPAEQPQIHEPVVGHVHHGSKKKAVLRLLLTLILAALAAAGVYYWQQGNVSNLQSQLDAKTTENATLKQAADAATDKPTVDEGAKTPTPTPSATTEDLIPGDTDTRRTDGRILIGALYKYSLNPTAIWIEYGESPKKLDKATTKITSGLGMGDPEDEYASGRSLPIADSALKPGNTYYYRVAATVNGKTLYSSVASFVTDK